MVQTGKRLAGALRCAKLVCQCFGGLCDVRTASLQLRWGSLADPSSAQQMSVLLINPALPK